MRILVDADACPVKKEILNVAKEYNVEVQMFLDNSHVYEDGYSTVFILDKGRDAANKVAYKKVAKLNDRIGLGRKRR